MSSPQRSNVGFISLFVLASVANGCGGGDDSPTAAGPPAPTSTTPMPTTPVPTTPVDCPPPGVTCSPTGMPFVQVALVSSNAVDPNAPMPGETTAALSNPEPGKICMSGRLENGYAFLTLGFASFDGTSLSDPLDAAGLGIASIQFTLDTPPPTGAYVQLASLIPDCDLGPLDCQHWGFYLQDPMSHAWFQTNQPEVVTAPLTDFVRANFIDPTWEFDPHGLATLQVGPGAFSSVTGDYDFCVSHLKFLDAAGNEVKPEGS
jgi:hypothetical protein